MGRTTDKVLRSLERRLSRDENSLVFSRIADVYRSKGELQNAIGICTEGLQRHPAYVTGHLILGKCYADQENLTDAAREFLQVCQLDRKNIAAIRMLADIYVRQGVLDKAGALYQYLLRIDPADAAAARLSSKYPDSGTVFINELLGITPQPVSKDIPAIPDVAIEVLVQSKNHAAPEVTVNDSWDAQPLDVDSVVSLTENIPLPPPVSPEEPTVNDIDGRLDTLFSEESVPARDVPAQSKSVSAFEEAVNQAAAELLPEVLPEVMPEKSDTPLPDAGDISSRIEQLFGDMELDDGTITVEEKIEPIIIEDESDPPPLTDISELVNREYAASEEVSGNDISARIEELFKEDGVTGGSITELVDESASAIQIVDSDSAQGESASQAFDIQSLRGKMISPEAPTETFDLREIAAIREAWENGDLTSDDAPQVSSLPPLDTLSPMAPLPESSAVSDDIARLFAQEENALMGAPVADALEEENTPEESFSGSDVSSRIEELFASEEQKAPAEGLLEEPLPFPQETTDSAVEPLDTVTAFQEEILSIGDLGQPSLPEVTIMEDDTTDSVGEETLTQIIDLAKLPLKPNPSSLDEEEEALDVVIPDIPEGALGEVPTGEEVVRTLDTVLESDDVEQLSWTPHMTAEFDQTFAPAANATEPLVPNESIFVDESELETASYAFGSFPSETKTTEEIVEPNPTSPDIPSSSIVENIRKLEELSPVVQQVSCDAPTVELPRSELFSQESAAQSESETKSVEEIGSAFGDNPFEEVALDSAQPNDELTDESCAAAEEDERDQNEPYSIPDHVLTPTLADIYYQQGQTKFAIDIYNRLLERDPDNDRLHRRIEELTEVLAKESEQNSESERIILPDGGEPGQEKPRRKAAERPETRSRKPLKGVRIKKQVKDRLRKRSG